MCTPRNHQPKEDTEPFLHQKKFYLPLQSLHSPRLSLTYFLLLEINFACSRISYKLNQIVCTLVFSFFFLAYMFWNHGIAYICSSFLFIALPLNVLEFIYPRVCWWIFGLFLGEVIMNKAATNKQTSLCMDLCFPFFLVNICWYNCSVLGEIYV